jgi:hypothetical protein
VIVAALDGQDVFVQAATSFGKSLCFQLPAVIDHGSKHLFLQSKQQLIFFSNNSRVSTSFTHGELFKEHSKPVTNSF